MDRIILTLSSSDHQQGVATLVLGGIGSRLDLPYATVDDLQLAVLSVLAAGDATTVTIEVDADDETVAVSIGPVRAGSGADPALRRVLDRLVDAVEPWERDGESWLMLRLSRRAPAPSLPG